MLITNATVKGHDAPVDIEITGGVFSAISPAASHRDASADVLDAGGRLVTPQFVDAHLHLDFANTVGRPRQNESGTLFEGIQVWAEHKQAGLINPDTIYANALAAVRSEVSHGVGHIRTHVDVTEPGLIALEILPQLKADVAGWCDIQIVAFPQNSVFGYPEGAKLLEQAMRTGADAVGGIPHLEATRELGVAELKLVFDLAEKYDALIDVHCDETDDPGSRFLEVMAAETNARGMQGRVSASHIVATAYYNHSYRGRLLPQLITAGINVAINPTENLHLQGRGGTIPTPRGIAPVRLLTDHGVNVALGQDSIADPWYPIGEGDLLRVLETGLQAFHMLQPAYLERALDFITVNGARNLGLTDYGIAVGNPANLLVLDATSDHDAVWHQADVLASVHHGNLVFRAAPRRFVDGMPAFLEEREMRRQTARGIAAATTWNP